MKNKLLLFDDEGIIKRVVLDTIGENMIMLRKMWFGSKFKKFRITGGSHYTGDFGEMLIPLIFEKRGEISLDVSNKPCGYDAIVGNNRRVEIKTSFKSVNGRYCFSQIRPFAEYENNIFVTIDPDDNIGIYICSHNDIMIAKKKGFIVDQHDNRTKRKSGLYRISCTIDDIINKIGAVDVSYLMNDITDEEVDDIISNIMHNKHENRKHLDGTEIEKAMYSPFVSGRVGLNIAIELYKSIGKPVTIKSFGKKVDINGGGKVVLVKSSIEDRNGLYRINQLRRYENYDVFNFITFNSDNDIRIMEASKEDIDSIIDNGFIYQQHNNYRNNGKTHLYGINGTYDSIKEKLRMKEL